MGAIVVMNLTCELCQAWHMGYKLAYNVVVVMSLIYEPM